MNEIKLERKFVDILVDANNNLAIFSMAKNPDKIEGDVWSPIWLPAQNPIELRAPYTAEELSGDVSHPSVFGHALVGEMLWKYLNNIYADLDSYGEPKPFDKKAVTKERYQNAELVGVGDITPVNAVGFSELGKDYHGWGDVWQTTEDGQIIFKVTCRNLGILFWRSTSSNFGNYEVWVDGVLKTTLAAEFKEGWGNYAYSQEIFVSDEEAEHTVIIKKAEDSVGNDFSVLRLMLSH